MTIQTAVHRENERAKALPLRGQNELRGRFYRDLELLTIYGRRTFQRILRPHPLAGVYISLAPLRVPPGLRARGQALEVEKIIPEGAVLLPRWERCIEPLYAVYERGLYDALRGMLHGLAGYDERSVGGPEGEIPIITKETGVLSEVCAFLEDWRRLDQDERTVLSEALASFVTRHENARDEDKVAAVDEVLMAWDFTDSLGRENPGASRARLVAARRSLQRRKLRADHLHLRLAMRVSTLEREIGTERAVAAGILQSVEGLLPLQERLMRNSLSVKQRLATTLRAQTKRLIILKAQPYVPLRLRAARQFTGILQIIAQDRKPADAFEALADVAGLFRRSLARHDLYGAIERVAVLPENPAGKRTRAEETKALLKRLAKNHPVLFPKVPRDSAVPLWREHLREGWRAIRLGKLDEAKLRLRAAAEML